MSEEQRVWLYEQAQCVPPCGTWVEVGVWKGRSLFAVAAGLPAGSWLYAVDHYCGSWDELDKGHAEASAPGRNVLGEFCTNLRRFLSTVRADIGIVLLLAPSLCAARKMPMNSADVVFLDAAHDADSVRAELLEWPPVLKPGGLLIGHDLDPAHPGVEAALKACGVRYDEPVRYIWRRTG